MGRSAGDIRTELTSDAPTVPVIPLSHPGDDVDHFRIIRLLARGGMGEVYLARDVRLGRKVALKLVARELAGSPAVVEKFLIEARATAALSHPNIVTIHEVGEHHGRPYVALEYVEGETLADRITGRRLSLQEALRIARAVAEALVEAHGHGVLHRDLKPENVVIGRDGRPRLVDFGLAKLLPMHGVTVAGSMAPPELEATSPRASGIMGTPHYMAPEQWLQLECTGATDVWTLGVLLYELCSGELPFADPVGPALVARVCGDHRSPSLGAATAVPPELGELVDACLEKEPEKRPSAADVCAQLEGLLLGGRRAIGEEDSPFRGLLPFAPQHADLFFGREAEIEGFVERTRHQSVLAVVGASGAGKTSFVRAGVIPRLREQEPWVVLELRPGSRPFEALATRLLRRDTHATGRRMRESVLPPGGRTDTHVDLDEIAFLARRLRETPGWLAVELRRIAEASGAPVLLLVDQLEELFTQTSDAQLQRQFLEAMCAGADEPLEPVRVVLTLRDDFIGRLAASDEARLALGHITVVKSLDADELEQILVRPVQSLGYRFEDAALPRAMAASVVGERACLPLLQFAAQLLWERRDRQRRLLLREHYEHMGGVAGALAQHADGLLQSLSPDEARTARSLLVRLITPERARRAVPRSRLLEGCRSDDERRVVERVLERMTEGRLLAATRARELGSDGEEAMVELAHESLIQTWGTLGRWLDESREEITFAAEIEQAAELWERRGARHDELWRGDALQEALRRQARCAEHLSERGRGFLDASRQRDEAARRRGRRARWALTFGSLLVALAAVGVAGVVRRAEQSSRSALADARQRQAEAWREGARGAFAQGRVQEARAKLRASLELEDSGEARATWWHLAAEPMVWRRELGAIVQDIAYLPSGGALALAGVDGALYVVDDTTGALRVVQAHGDEMLSVAVSGDGRRIATGGWDASIRIFDAATLEQASEIRGHARGVTAVRLGRDAATVFSGSIDGTVRAWDAASGRTKWQNGYDGPIPTIDASADGKLVARGSMDGVVELLDAQSGHSLRRLEGHRGPVYNVRFSPDGALLATGGVDGALLLWRVSDGALSWRALASGGVKALAFDTTGTRVASATRNFDVVVWDAKDGHALRRSRTAALLRGLAFSPDGRRLLMAAEDRSITASDLAVPARDPSKMAHDGYVQDVAFSPDGGAIVSAGADGRLLSWHPGTGEVLREIGKHDGFAHALAFSPDGAHLASAGSDRLVRIWSASTWTPEGQLVGHSDQVWALAFDPSGRQLASGGIDRAVRIWDVATQTSAAVLSGHNERVYALAFTPDGRRLISAARDTDVRVWDVAGRRLERILPGHRDECRGVAVLPGGEEVATSASDGTLRIWSLRDPTAPPRERHVGNRRLARIALAPNDARLATGSQEGGILWDRNSDAILELRGHRSDVNTVAFSPDGSALVSASDDGTVRLWDAKSGRPAWRGTLVLSSPARLLSHRGWRNLADSRATEAPTDWSSELRDTLEQHTRVAVVAGELLCLQRDDGHLELWEPSAHKPLSSGEVIKDLAAHPRGCLVRSKKDAALVLADGSRRPLGDGAASALAWTGGSIAVAIGADVVLYDADGAVVQQRQRVAGAIVAVALFPEERALVVGYRGGVLERVPLAPAGGEPSANGRLVLEQAPASLPLSLTAGPPGTVVGTYANGEVGLWQLASGVRLAHARLHGAAVHVLLEGERLHVATDLGDALSWNLAPFYRPYCELLREVWAAVPVAWRDGHAERAAPPGDHVCSARGL